MRIGSDLREDSEVERIRAIVKTASEHGLNGIAFSAGLDSLDLKPPEYFRRLKAVRELCAQHKVGIIPSFMSAGYGGAILAHDKNLAAGLPVRDALFTVSQGTARSVADPPVTVVNGGFEDYGVDKIDGFSFAGKLGDKISPDTVVFKQGKASVRIGNFGKSPREWARVSQEVRVHPYRCAQRLSAKRCKALWP